MRNEKIMTNAIRSFWYWSIKRGQTSEKLKMSKFWFGTRHLWARDQGPGTRDQGPWDQGPGTWWWRLPRRLPRSWWLPRRNLQRSGRRSRSGFFSIFFDLRTEKLHFPWFRKYNFRNFQKILDFIVFFAIFHYISLYFTIFYHSGLVRARLGLVRAGPLN